MTKEVRFSRLSDLLEIIIALGKPQGVSLYDIMERYKVSRRTAERMLKSILCVFPQIDVIRIDEYNRKVWGFKDCKLRDILTN